MSFISRNKNFSKFFLINFIFGLGVIGMEVYLNWESTTVSTKDFFFKYIFFLFLFPGFMYLLQFIYYFQDKNKKFILEPNRIIFTNKIFLTKKEIQITINRHDIINYRNVHGHWLYAEITIFLNDDKKIKIGNLNDDYKIIEKLMKEWEIKKRPFINF